MSGSRCRPRGPLTPPRDSRWPMYLGPLAGAHVACSFVVHIYIHETGRSACVRPAVVARVTLSALQQILSPMAIRTIGVVGTGVIGASWTGLFLAHGLRVLVSDPAPKAEKKLAEHLQAIWPTLKTLGLSSNASLSNYQFVGTNLGKYYADVDFIQEVSVASHITSAALTPQTERAGEGRSEDQAAWRD